MRFGKKGQEDDNLVTVLTRLNGIAVQLCGAAADEEDLADNALDGGDDKEWAFHSGVHAGISNALRILVRDFYIDVEQLAPEVAARSDSWRIEGEAGVVQVRSPGDPSTGSGRG